MGADRVAMGTSEGSISSSMEDTGGELFKTCMELVGGCWWQGGGSSLRIFCRSLTGPGSVVDTSR